MLYQGRSTELLKQLNASLVVLMWCLIHSRWDTPAPPYTHTHTHTHTNIHIHTQCPTKNDAQKSLATLAVSSFDIPGDPGFPLNAFMAKPGNRAEAGKH